MAEPSRLVLWVSAVYMALTLGVLPMSTARSQNMDSFNQGIFTYKPHWAMGGHDIKGTHHQPTTSIDPTNVVNMKLKWTFTTAGYDISATPAVVNGIVYFPDSNGNFYAVDASAGTQVWSHQIQDWTGIPRDYVRSSPAVYDGLVIIADSAGKQAYWDGSKTVGSGATMIAVDAKTGNKVWATQVEASPSAIVTGSPIIHDGIVYLGIAGGEEGLTYNPTYPCCVFRGSMVAVDAHTGAVLWQTYTVPDNHGVYGGYSGGAIWATTPAIDKAKGLIYIGTGNNYTVPAEVTACIIARPNDATCSAADDYFDSVLALDLKTGAIKWARRAMTYDTWTVACMVVASGVGDCPSPEGQDYDFGAGPNLFTIGHDGAKRDVVGIGSKSGVYYALDANDGSTVWMQRVGPGNGYGGIVWGTATDGKRIYVPIANVPGVTTTLKPSGTVVNGGFWSGLNPATGHIEWQTPTPGACSPAVAGVVQGCPAYGPLSVAGGVVFAGSMDADPANPKMFALEAATGKILWSFNSGGSVNSAPAIVGDSVYWGVGYGFFGRNDNKVLAFTIN